MHKINISKGYNLKIDGSPKELISTVETDILKIHPSSIRGIKCKLLIKEEDLVKVGTPLFFDKKNPDVMFVSPGSGSISRIQFGPRRVVDLIEIKLDGTSNHDDVFTNPTIESLCKSGLFSYIRQRPFSKIPDPKKLPKSIFISAMPTSPYSIDYSFLYSRDTLSSDVGYRINDEYNIFLQKGIDVLSKICNCPINLSSNSRNINQFRKLSNVNHFMFNELHPAGNVGVQIHKIDPIKNANDIVWYLSLQDLFRIGSYFVQERYPNYKYYAVGGASLNNPKYIKALIGTQISQFLSNENVDNCRIISGDLLSGTITTIDNSFNYFDDVLSVIKENNERNFLGWLGPGIKDFTMSKTFASSFLGYSQSKINTKINGSVRTIIPMGNWDKYLPMNIMPEFLVKSILSEDVEMMEKLGIYEVSPEDFSLCAVACQSKVEVSQIIQQGLDLMEKEG